MMKNSLRSHSRKPAQKEPKKKKTLKEVAGSMLVDMAEQARDERSRELREQQRQQEEEVAIMTYGPGWRRVPEPLESGVMSEDADPEDKTGS